MPPTRERALDAAIDLLATGGLRALTHVRVDTRAGLPKGSTSNHFRTRAALLRGVLDAIAQRELAEFDTVFAPTSADDLVDGLCTLLAHVTERNRRLTTARLVVFMEAAHDPEVRATVAGGRAAMEGWMTPILSGLGAPDPRVATDALIACLEGLIMHRVVRHDERDPRPALELVVGAALG